jgi:ABC-type bacteriocin/lantibiotic exporter with double-glycine peptidase domain
MFSKRLSRYSYLLRLLELMSVLNRRKLVVVGIIQFLLSLLDLIGLLALGAVTALSYSTINSSPVPNSLSFIWKIPMLQDRDLKSITFIFAGTAVFILLSKTLMSALLVRKVIGFLSVREAEISTALFRSILNSDPSRLRKRSPQQVAGVAITAVNAAITVSLGQLTTLLVECFSILLLIGGLSFVDYTVTIPTLIFFALLGFLSTSTLKNRVAQSSTQTYFLGISSAELIKNAISTSRDIFLSDKQNQVTNEYGEQRAQNYRATRAAAFASSLPKFISEVGLVVGGSFIAVTQVAIKDAQGALIGLVLFLTLSTRIIPSILRIQNAVLEINGARGASLELLDELEKLKVTSKISLVDNSQESVNENSTLEFIPSIKVIGGRLGHVQSSDFELRDLNIEINPGEFIGIVGPSGGGKTTLLDAMSGILSLDGGKVLISGIDPQAAIRKWNTEIRYVPQDIYLFAGTLRMNVIWPDLESDVSDEQIWKVLEIVGLQEWIRTLPEGLNSKVENLGSNMSGGQKQRLGIARALISNPHILILDEATSSLDSITEKMISANILSRLAGVTRVVVAHRLATIRNADRILYIEDGSILAVGTFNEVRVIVKEFDDQARASGL